MMNNCIMALSFGLICPAAIKWLLLCFIVHILCVTVLLARNRGKRMRVFQYCGIKISSFCLSQLGCIYTPRSINVVREIHEGVPLLGIKPESQQFTSYILEPNIVKKEKEDEIWIRRKCSLNVDKKEFIDIKVILRRSLYY